MSYPLAMVASLFGFALLLSASVNVEGFVLPKGGPTCRGHRTVTAASADGIGESRRVRPPGGGASAEARSARDSESDENNDDGDGVGFWEGGSIGMDRRRALAATGLAAASLWPGAVSAAGESGAGGGRTVLITGSNSGIGFEGARQLARGGGGRIILACRTLRKAEDAASRILADSPNADLVPAECDLASLESIRKFASSVTGTVDVACYNAGLALNTAGGVERTADGFELTVGTNHLGHFYLHHLLEPKIAGRGGAPGRVVVTASSVHDPESPGGKQGVPATLGDLGGMRDGAGFEMVDGRGYNGDKAYKDSKLCNVLFCRELARRLASKNVVVNAFSPGLITSSGFFRYQNPVFSKVFDVAAGGLFKVAETPAYGGAALAYMTTVDTTGEFYDSPPGTSNKYASDGNDYRGAFGSEFTVTQVSKEARDDAKGRELWRLSEKLVGI